MERAAWEVEARVARYHTLLEVAALGCVTSSDKLNQKPALLALLASLQGLHTSDDGAGAVIRLESVAYFQDGLVHRFEGEMGLASQMEGDTYGRLEEDKT